MDSPGTGGSGLLGDVPLEASAAAAGRRDVALPYRYPGADDRAGPNDTGQPAVHSYYEELSPPDPHPAAG